jgi:hypothetical protein
MGPSRFTSIREEGVLRIFIALKNSSPRPGLEPATFGSSGQHINHYTTKTTDIKITIDENIATVSIRVIEK